jgi:enamine deaminase RidA (YjgF/YER057c/UK114 family)
VKRELVSTGTFDLGGAVAAYSLGIKVTAPGSIVWTAGMAGTDESGNLMCVGDMEGQTRAKLDDTRAAVANAGATMDDVVEPTAWVKRREDVPTYARVRNDYFTSVPASATVVSELLRDDMLIEIEAIAVVESDSGGER